MTPRPIVRQSPTRALASVIGFWAAYVAIIFGASFDFGILPERWSRLGWGMASSAALFLLTLAMVRREGRTLGDVGIGFGPRSVSHFLLGAVIGFATYALNVAVVATAVGGLRLTPATTIDWSGVALALGSILALSCMEELGFRGYPLRTLVPQLGPWTAQALVAVAFALTHRLYDWSWNSIVFGVLPSAFLFGAAALASGGLAMPIGLHMAVNAARWALGEKGGSGFFTMTVAPSASARIERMAPVTGIAITLTMAAMLWRWHRSSHTVTMKRSSSTFLLLLTCITPLARSSAQSTRLDSLDAFVKAQMAQRNVRGLSLAIIKDGKVAVARAYGVVDDSTKAPVTTSTLFQAGSISKPVSALGALHLVDAGTLSLDQEVNAKLKSWKVPENPFTSAEKVTLRRLLSHTAGLTVHGFPGYDVSGPMPTLVQVLDGAPPANTSPIRVDTTPGAIWRYSGGGFTVMQQLVIDVTGQPFPQYMQRTVLGPIGMTSSTFEQPPPAARASLTATGYYADGTPVRGRWHAYPEMAAAGLWTTPTDLAKFAIEVQQALAGRGHGVVSPAMARQYVTEQKNGYALGVGLMHAGSTLRFGHGGRDEGFDALLMAGAESGDGVVVMINANDNTPMKERIGEYVERLWGFAGVPPTRPAPAATVAARIDPKRLAEYAGYYEASENNMVALAGSADGSSMQILVDGRPAESLLAMDSATFGSNERPFRVAFTRGAGGAATGATWALGEPRERRIPRVAPLPSTLQPRPDPDQALATRIATAIAALRVGRAALADAADVTPGAKRDFARGEGALAEFASATYLGEEDVSGRGIRRHGGEVSRVRLYRMRTPNGERYLMVHVTAQGAVTDYDILLR